MLENKGFFPPKEQDLLHLLLFPDSSERACSARSWRRWHVQAVAGGLAWAAAAATAGTRQGCREPGHGSEGSQREMLLSRECSTKREHDGCMKEYVALAAPLTPQRLGGNTQAPARMFYSPPGRTQLHSDAKKGRGEEESNELLVELGVATSLSSFLP